MFLDIDGMNVVLGRGQVNIWSTWERGVRSIGGADGHQCCGWIADAIGLKEVPMMLAGMHCGEGRSGPQEVMRESIDHENPADDAVNAAKLSIGCRRAASCGKDIE
jgi:hypothetical protein